VATAFIQLAFPWLTTAASGRLPQNLEPPEGTLCGAIARNALERGTYRSLGGRPLIDVTGVDPKLPGRDLADPSDLTTLSGRVTVLGRDPQGFSVLSDVTTSLDPTFRLAHANRLMSALVRALRTIGENLAFEPSNERTWSTLRARAIDVLRVFWRAGALAGSREADAFDVKCDASTTTQDDLDGGRVVVEVTVALTVSIQRINVVVTRNGGEATLERAA
jgi:phage tail sheath protein FI